MALVFLNMPRDHHRLIIIRIAPYASHTHTSLYTHVYVHALAYVNPWIRVSQNRRTARRPTSNVHLHVRGVQLGTAERCAPQTLFAGHCRLADRHRGRATTGTGRIRGRRPPTSATATPPSATAQ